MKSLQLQTPTCNKRISLVDSLRGFAVVGIIIIHFLEHMNFYNFPAPTAFEQGLWDTVFYLGASKMYAIFALLFGFSCYIQHHNREKHGEDFRPRFAWRMFLLFCWGMLDLLFFNGDILCTYAVLGLLLIPLVKANDRVLLLIAGILFLQPIEVAYMLMGFADSSVTPMDLGLNEYWGIVAQPCESGTMFDVAKANLACGLQINFGWALEHGRLTQTLMLFITGMLLGRHRLFINDERSMRFWKRVITHFSLPLFACTQTLLLVISFSDMQSAIAHGMSIQLTAWRNFAMMSFYVAGITLLFYKSNLHNAINHLSYIGRMSLTDYLLQSIIGGFLFYNWGLGLFRTCSHAYSFLLSLLFIAVLYLFCRAWTKHFRRGPLEEIWARLTNW